TTGAVLEPFIGWRALFLGVAVLSTAVLVALLPYQSLLSTRSPASVSVTATQLLASFGELLRSGRGARTYAYVLFNGIFHSGTYTWLGRSEEHTSELQSRENLVCRLLLE